MLECADALGEEVSIQRRLSNEDVVNRKVFGPPHVPRFASIYICSFVLHGHDSHGITKSQDQGGPSSSPYLPLGSGSHCCQDS